MTKRGYPQKSFFLFLGWFCIYFFILHEDPCLDILIRFQICLTVFEFNGSKGNHAPKNELLIFGTIFYFFLLLKFIWKSHPQYKSSTILTLSCIIFEIIMYKVIHECTLKQIFIIKLNFKILCTIVSRWPLLCPQWSPSPYV